MGYFCAFGAPAAPTGHADGLARCCVGATLLRGASNPANAPDDSSPRDGAQEPVLMGLDLGGERRRKSPESERAGAATLVAE